MIWWLLACPKADFGAGYGEVQAVRCPDGRLVRWAGMDAQFGSPEDPVALRGLCGGGGEFVLLDGGGRELRRVGGPPP